MSFLRCFLLAFLLECVHAFHHHHHRIFSLRRTPPLAAVPEHSDRTERLLAAKKASGKSWNDIADEMGLMNAYGAWSD